MVPSIGLKRRAAGAFVLASLAIASLACAHAALADAPLTPPAKHTSCSPAKSFCVTSDPATAETVVTNASGAPLWRLRGWHRWILVSDDGAYVAVGYSGLNLVPADVSLDQPIVTFHDRAGVAGRIRLSDLYRDLSQMRRTTSHLEWGAIVGFKRGNVLEVEIANGKRLRFKPRR